MGSKYVDTTSIMQVIGCVFNNPSILEITDRYSIVDEDFADPFHKTIFGAIYKIHELGANKITLEFDDFYVITVYTPNSQDGLARLPYRMTWEDAFLAYLKKLEETKPVVFCGDLNVAHKEIDLKNPKTNHHNAGFTDEERGKFTELLDSGFTDTFRKLYPDKVEYTFATEDSSCNFLSV